MNVLVRNGDWVTSKARIKILKSFSFKKFQSFLSTYTDIQVAIWREGGKRERGRPCRLEKMQASIAGGGKAQVHI